MEPQELWPTSLVESPRTEELSEIVLTHSDILPQITQTLSPPTIHTLSCTSRSIFYQVWKVGIHHFSVQRHTFRRIPKLLERRLKRLSSMDFSRIILLDDGYLDHLLQVRTLTALDLHFCVNLSDAGTTSGFDPVNNALTDLFAA